MGSVLATEIGRAESLLHLVPPVVGADDPLPALVRAIAADPIARCVFVCADDGRLLGVVPQGALDRDMLALLAPEASRPVEDMGPRDLTRLAHGMDATARGLMRPAATVSAGDTVATALRRMHDHDMESAAVLDGEGQLLGYVALFELLAATLPG